MMLLLLYTWFSVTSSSPRAQTCKFWEVGKGRLTLKAHKARISNIIWMQYKKYLIKNSHLGWTLVSSAITRKHYNKSHPIPAFEKYPDYGSSRYDSDLHTTMHCPLGRLWTLDFRLWTSILDVGLGLGLYNI